MSIKNDDTFGRYSLINVWKEYNGLVDGTWIQNVTGTLEEAIKAARDTEKANSNRITVAVTKSIYSTIPDYDQKKGWKRLDK